MKRLSIVITLLLLLFIMAGCSEASNINNQSQFDENGNYLRADVMIEEWCSHNEGRDFVRDQCD